MTLTTQSERVMNDINSKFVSFKELKRKNKFYFWVWRCIVDVYHIIVWAYRPRKFIDSVVNACELWALNYYGEYGCFNLSLK